MLHLGATVTQCGPASAGGIATAAPGVRETLLRTSTRRLGELYCVATHKLESQ